MKKFNTAFHRNIAALAAINGDAAAINQEVDQLEDKVDELKGDVGTILPKVIQLEKDVVTIQPVVTEFKENFARVVAFVDEVQPDLSQLKILTKESQKLFSAINQVTQIQDVIDVIKPKLPQIIKLPDFVDIDLVEEQPSDLEEDDVEKEVLVGVNTPVPEEVTPNGIDSTQLEGLEKRLIAFEERLNIEISSLRQEISSFQQKLGELQILGADMAALKADFNTFQNETLAQNIEELKKEFGDQLGILIERIDAVESEVLSDKPDTAPDSKPSDKGRAVS